MAAKNLTGVPAKLEVVGLPDGCLGAVALLDGRSLGMIRCEFADRWEDYALMDNGDGTASPMVFPGHAQPSVYLTARRVRGAGSVEPFQVPRRSDGTNVFSARIERVESGKVVELLESIVGLLTGFGC